MDRNWFSFIIWCLQFGIIFNSGCHGTHHRNNNLHMDHVWKAVNISIESLGPSFIVHSLGEYPPSTNILQRSLSVGYPDVEPSILSTSYGPFQTRQTLFASETEADSDFFVRALLIDREIHRHTPSVRVLFHLEKHQLAAGKHKSKTCLKAEIEAVGLVSTGYCSPKGHPSACLAEVDVLLAWKSKTDNSSSGGGPLSLNVTYAILPPSENFRCNSREVDPLQEKDGVPGQTLGTVEIILYDDAGYTRVTDDRYVHMDIPKRQMGLHEKFDITIMVHRQYQCTLRAKLKEGIELTKIKYKDVMMANQLSMVRSRGTFGMATAEKQDTAEEDEESDEMPVVMAMEYRILNQTGSVRQISWRVDCTRGQERYASRFETEITASSQDQLKEFIPLIKSNDLVNTAVLGSGRIHYPVRVVALSHGGDIVPITDKVQCSSENNNIVKVREDCSAVYVNGSEDRGAESVDVTFSYRGLEVNLPLRVWMPELPLTVSLSDDKLSLVKRWKVARQEEERNTENDATEEDPGGCHLTYQTATVDVLTRFYVPVATVGGGDGEEDSKRYFSGPNALQVITHLVSNHLRVKDGGVAFSEGRRVTGLVPGVTMVQVVHPHTRDLLGEKKVHVVADKVEIVDLKVTMVTGMSFTFSSIDTVNNIFGYNLMALEGFVTNHQEAFLYITITYNDLTMVALQDLDPATYSLVVTSNHNQVIATSPDSTHKLPSVIATGQGTTAMIVSFLPAEHCQRKRKENCIVFDTFNVDVTYNSSHPLLNEIVSGNEDEPWQRFSPGVRFVDPGVVRTDINQYYIRQLQTVVENECDQAISSIPFYPDEWPSNDFDPVGRDWSPSRGLNSSDNAGTDRSEQKESSKRESLSMVEIIMYVILAVFGVAVLFFVINFLLFVVRYLKRKKPAMSDGIHPQSWIMLGVDWEKRQANFPLPSDESIQLQESTEGSGREDMSSTMSGATVPRRGAGEVEEANEGDPLIRRLNNGVLVGGRPRQNSQSEQLEAAADVRWPRGEEEFHEMEPLTTSRASVENRQDNENNRYVEQQNDNEVENNRTSNEASTSKLREEPAINSPDFTLEDLEGMKETMT